MTLRCHCWPTKSNTIGIAIPPCSNVNEENKAANRWRDRHVFGRDTKLYNCYPRKTQEKKNTEEMLMPVIDVHTHMLTLDYLELLRANGTGKYTL